MFIWKERVCFTPLWRDSRAMSQTHFLVFYTYTLHIVIFEGSMFLVFICFPHPALDSWIENSRIHCLYILYRCSCSPEDESCWLPNLKFSPIEWNICPLRLIPVLLLSFPFYMFLHPFFILYCLRFFLLFSWTVLLPPLISSTSCILSTPLYLYFVFILSSPFSFLLPPFISLLLSFPSSSTPCAISALCWLTAGSHHTEEAEQTFSFLSNLFFSDGSFSEASHAGRASGSAELSPAAIPSCLCGRNRLPLMLFAEMNIVCHLVNAFYTKGRQCRSRCRKKW